MVCHWAGFFQRLVAASLFEVVGVIIITRPLMSTEVLTVFGARNVLIGGLFQFISALAVSTPGWGWHVADEISRGTSRACWYLSNGRSRGFG